MKRMIKKRLAAFAVASAMAVSLTGCGVQLTGFESPSDITLTVGDTETVDLVETYSKDGASADAIAKAIEKADVQWQVSDETIATVEGETITALKAGETDITVSDGKGNFEVVFTVIVEEEEVVPTVTPEVKDDTEDKDAEDKDAKDDTSDTEDDASDDKDADKDADDKDNADDDEDKDSDDKVTVTPDPSEKPKEPAPPAPTEKPAEPAPVTPTEKPADPKPAEPTPAPPAPVEPDPTPVPAPVEPDPTPAPVDPEPEYKPGGAAGGHGNDIIPGGPNGEATNGDGADAVFPDEPVIEW